MFFSLSSQKYFGRIPRRPYSPIDREASAGRQWVRLPEMSYNSSFKYHFQTAQIKTRFEVPFVPTGTLSQDKRQLHNLSAESQSGLA